MLKTLKNLFKQDKEKFVVPKSVQSVIPIKTIWEDGIFLVGKNKYAKTFKFEDINYAVASREDKEAMFLEYSELLNSLDSGTTTKITINNRRLNKADFEQTILIPMADDGLDKYRKEYNKMLLDKATGANSIVQDKYVTVSVCKKNIEEARNYFARVSADLIAHFARLGSRCVELDAEEKLRIFHDFYRTGEKTEFRFDISQTMRKGHDFKDFICPDTFEFESDCFKMGDRYGRVIFLREYAAYIKDSMVSELCELNRNMMLSVDIIPVPTDEAVREVENRLLGVETNITNWQRKQNQNNNFSAVIPYDLEQQRKESKEFLDDLTTCDQRMMFAVLTMVHTADSKEQLDSDTEALLTTARKHLCQFAVLKYQQMDGLHTRLDEIQSGTAHDVLEMSGSRAVWKEVLAVYSVKTTTDPDNPQEVATMDESKKQLLSGIFWEMNEISSRTERKTETVITESDDGHGNIVQTETSVTRTYLYITVSHKTAEEMADQYGFNEEQRQQLSELLAEENNSLWSQVLYGISVGDGEIVSVALSQVGNVGGQPYWSWYGFEGRVEWCACFVSWCANECGYIDSGVIPKYALCSDGVNWFKDRGQWADYTAEPTAGQIIFFDWDDENGQDGVSDHTGIVEKVENGIVYTVEGNSGDTCRQKQYPVGYYEILGYGIPAY